jgi:hypothetical protein
MAVRRGNVVAVDLRAPLDRTIENSAGQVDLGADEPARLEKIPELDVLRRRPIAQPLVEFHVDELDVEIQGLVTWIADPHRPASPQGGRAVETLGPMERQHSVLEVPGGRQVVHAIGKPRAVPDPVSKPGLHGITEAFAGRGLRVIARSQSLQVDHAAIERKVLERRPGSGRDPLAECLGERQPAQIALQRDSSGLQVERAGEPQAVEHIPFGGAIELVQQTRNLIDSQAYLAKDRHGVARSPWRLAEFPRHFRRVRVARFLIVELHRSVLDNDRRSLVQPWARPWVREEALKVPGPVSALTEPQRRLNHVDFTQVELAAQQLPSVHLDLQPRDA